MKIRLCGESHLEHVINIMQLKHILNHNLTEVSSKNYL